MYFCAVARALTTLCYAGTIAGKATFTGVTRTTLSPLAVKFSAAPQLASASLLVVSCLFLLLWVVVVA